MWICAEYMRECKVLGKYKKKDQKNSKKQHILLIPVDSCHSKQFWSESASELVGNQSETSLKLGSNLEPIGIQLVPTGSNRNRWDTVKYCWGIQTNTTRLMYWEQVSYGIFGNAGRPSTVMVHNSDWDSWVHCCRQWRK